ncbi:hypothetical protein C5167_012125 [Papaver somniferum]|uniref:Pectinesterase inhibitor domain-containing protein n=1 Tax=Papaver somniferum TaxID=3469 RepID=A0A4Y7J0U6_PAPSO|nr:hypothetical protein C5167_012125 [Papaver somniferum]
MAVPKTPLSLVGFFFLFTFVASQSMNSGVLESVGGALGENACLMALDNLGPDQDFLNADQKQIPRDLEDLADFKLKNVKDRVESLISSFPDPAWEDLRDALGSLTFADRLRDCMSWCESKKHTKGISRAAMSKRTNLGSVLDKLYCFSLA